MKVKNQNLISLKNKELEVRLEVKPICSGQEEAINDFENCKERAKQETRRLMDDIWKRYPTAQISKANFDSNSVVFEL
jgi:hypothetical protein